MGGRTEPKREPSAWAEATLVAARVRAGELGPAALAQLHRRRIARLDPAIHAYVAVDRRARGLASGPLAGVTVAVKDTQPVARMRWTAGSPKWQNRVAQHDGIASGRLRTAGAALIGKTNTPELAAAIGTTNSLFPATENPWRAGYTPGGSSGGSAAAVAAGLATLALGDDMGGSIRIPASCCGVVGLRPSPGRVPLDSPDPTQLNSYGPIGRSVADVRLMLQVMVGEEPPPIARRRLRIAFAPSSSTGVDAACSAACERAVTALRGESHALEEIEWSLSALVAESYQVIRRVSLGSLPGEPEEYGEAIREMVREARRISAVTYVRAQERATAAVRSLNDLVESGYDAILTPTLGLTPMEIPQVPVFLSERWHRYTTFVLPVSFSRLPALSLPGGLHAGLPVGVQLAGRYRGEWELLRIAEELEALAGFGFKRPRLLS